MERFLWICLAGAAGTGARGLDCLLGCAALRQLFPFRHAHRQSGWLLWYCRGHARGKARSSWSPTVRSAITIGFIGGLTDVFEFQLRNDSSDGGRRDRRGDVERPRRRSWARSPQAGWEWSARGNSSGGKEAAMRVLDGEQFLVNNRYGRVRPVSSHAACEGLTGAPAPVRVSPRHRDSRSRGIWRQQCDSHGEPRRAVDRPTGTDRSRGRPSSCRQVATDPR